jgi:Fe-S cluster assembly protein SufD
MPSAGDEDWKYVDLDFSLDDYGPVLQPSGELGSDEYLEALDGSVARVTLVDGTVVASEGDEVTVGAISDMPEEQVRPRYGVAASPDIDIFTAANHAFGPPGAAILVPAGRAVTAPVVVDVQSVTDGAAVFPHIVVIGGPGSEASVVVVYRSAPGARVLVCPILEVLADRNARLAVSVVQRLADSARMVAHHQFVADRDATLRIDEIGLGGRYARQRLGISLQGLGSSVKMGGIYFGDGRQVLDYRIHVTHYGPHTTSDIFLKGAVADRAQAVWTGLMRIEKPAVGTSAFETNRNLVLSDGAKVHSVPNLEILTDDLQCGHGSSSGPLDEDQLYYLMSRGLPRDKAERLLVRGFFNEILSKLAVPGLAPPSRTAVATKFAGAQQRGSS